MRKYASLEVLEAWQQPRSGSARAFTKTAHRVAFDYDPRPGYLYVRSRMISSRTNDNHDTFPAGEIEKGYKTFLGKPVFVNHHNANHRRARGVIVAVALHRDKNPDGSPDTWAEGLMEVDAVKFPKLCKAILAGRVNRTSMGVDVEWSKCSACGNKATSPAEYCKHLPAMKGKKIRQRNTRTGKVEETLIHEVCAGLSFFENSLLVEDPADPTAYLLGKPDARGLDKTAAAFSQAAADADNLYHLSGCHHVSNGRWPGRRRTAAAGFQVDESRLDRPADPAIAPSGHMIAGARAYNAQAGMADPHPEDYSHIETNPDRIRRLASAYHALPMNDPGAHAAFAEMARQVHQQYRHLTQNMGVSVEPVDHDPYSSHMEMAHDIQHNKRLQVLKTASTGPHGFFDDDTNDKFRAVHDAFGHAATGRGFDRHGEEAAWLAHSRMFHGPARHAMATETRGQNATLIATGMQPAQKIALLPQELLRREAAVSGPDFRDHLGNTCTECGAPVHYAPGADRNGSYPWRHQHQILIDHQAVPSDPSDRRPSQNMTFSGGHCLVCGDPASINLNALDRPGGGWHHRDGMKRDHLAVPADEQAAYDSIPVQKAARDQARSRVRDTLHRQFEQLEGRPLPRAPRGDEDRMPPDPFTASRKTAITVGNADHCANCGHPFKEPVSAEEMGDWRSKAAPFLCNDCAYGHFGENTAADKPVPLRPLDKGGTSGDPFGSEMWGPQVQRPENSRPWSQGDAPIQSMSRRKKTKGKYPQQVRGHGSDPRYDGVSLKKDRNGFYVHTHRSRSDSYPTPDDIPDREIEQIRSTGAKKAEGGDHPWFQAHPVSAHHIVHSYNGASDDERALGDRWYSDAHHVAKIIGKGDHALGAGLLSAYSVRTLWPVNLFNASRASMGDPPGPGTGAMGVHQKAAIRILGGEHHSKVLTAPKTAAFAHLIEHGGDTEHDVKHGTEKVVIDRHAMSVAAGHRLTDAEKEGMPIGQHQHYEHVAQAYRDAARHLSQQHGRQISPHQVQAATWLHQIRQNSDEDASGRKGGGGKGRVQLGQNSRTRWVQHHHDHHPGEFPEENMHYHGRKGLRRQAYGETRVPPQVDTLRMDECPVCGEHNVWSGSRCPVCGFVVPPSVFRDPDTSKAQQVRDQLDASGDVTLPPDSPDAAQPDALPTAQVGSGDDADEQLIHPDQIAPDGVPTVQGGGDADFDAQDDAMVPPGQEDPGAQAEAEEDPEGAVPPEDEEDPGEEMYAEELVCPACGTTFEADAAAQPGVPCPACGMAALHPADEEEDGGEPLEDEEDPGDPRKEQEDPSDPDAQPGDEQDEEDEDKDMPESKTAAAVARAQARRIAELTAQNEVLHAQLSFLASAAGVDREFAEIGRRVMRRHADILNPASPVPDPPQGPPSQTTEEALAPEAMDNAGRPGTTPGANSRVPAAQTTTAITPGVEMQTPPATNLIDVTAPIQGTNPSQDGGVPLQQRRIETDVRIDPDPLKAHGPGIGGQGDNGAAFPWVLDARMPGQGGQGGQGQMQQAASLNEADASRRTFASIRLARLRVQAGLAQGDELTVAERIEKDASLGTAMIEHEIGVLARVPAAQQQAPRPMQRAAARAVPSLASVGASQYAPAVAGYDDDASDIFLD